MSEMYSAFRKIRKFPCPYGDSPDETSRSARDSHILARHGKTHLQKFRATQVTRSARLPETEGTEIFGIVEGKAKSMTPKEIDQHRREENTLFSEERTTRPVKCKRCSKTVPMNLLVAHLKVHLDETPAAPEWQKMLSSEGATQLR